MGRFTHIFDSIPGDWNIRISKEISSWIEYSPLHDEISLKQSTNTTVFVTLISENKKLSLKLKNDDPTHIKEMIEKNLSLLSYSDADTNTVIAQVSDQKTSNFVEFDIETVDGDFLKNQWNIVKNQKLPEHMSIESFVYQTEYREEQFINSLWADKIQKNTGCAYEIQYLYISPEFSDTEAISHTSAKLETIDEKLLKETQEILISKSQSYAPNFQNGTHTIAFDNKLSWDFIEFIAQSLMTEGIRQKQSIFSLEEQGKQIFDTNISLQVNPQRKNSAYNQGFDQEWLNLEKIVLIENGVIKNFLSDVKNSQKLNLPFTGTTISNLEFTGKNTTDNPLQDISFLFTNLMWLHTIDSMTGKFALEWEGFEIIDGKKAGFVKNVSLSGNIRELFTQIQAVGNDTYIHGNIFVPTLVFSGQKINL